jgi:hypothetical protein
MPRATKTVSVNVKIVTKETEINATLQDLGLEPQATDNQIIVAAERRAEQTLEHYTVTRHEGNILVSPTPIYG